MLKWITECRIWECFYLINLLIISISIVICTVFIVNNMFYSTAQIKTNIFRSLSICLRSKCASEDVFAIGAARDGPATWRGVTLTRSLGQQQGHVRTCPAALCCSTPFPSHFLFLSHFLQHHPMNRKTKTKRLWFLCNTRIQQQVVEEDRKKNSNMLSYWLKVNFHSSHRYQKEKIILL